METLARAGHGLIGDLVRRVVVTGSECTGKTTLAASLAHHYDTGWSPEYVRFYVDHKEGPLGSADVELIARGQIATEEWSALQANRVLILDTDLLSTALNARHYYGDCPAWIDSEIARRRANLYLLAGTEVDWAADGRQRDRGHRREEMQELFREAMRSQRIQWIDIAGPMEARMKTAVAAIDRMLA